MQFCRGGQVITGIDSQMLPIEQAGKGPYHFPYPPTVGCMAQARPLLVFGEGGPVTACIVYSLRCWLASHVQFRHLNGEMS